MITKKNAITAVTLVALMTASNMVCAIDYVPISYTDDFLKSDKTWDAHSEFEKYHIMVEGDDANIDKPSIDLMYDISSFFPLSLQKKILHNDNNIYVTAEELVSIVLSSYSKTERNAWFADNVNNKITVKYTTGGSIAFEVQ